MPEIDVFQKFRTPHDLDKFRKKIDKFRTPQFTDVLIPFDSKNSMTTLDLFSPALFRMTHTHCEAL